MNELHDEHEPQAPNQGLDELLDEWVDGAWVAGAPTSDPRAAELAGRLADDPSLAAEERRLRSLVGLLAASRIEVAPGFTDAVMARLPPAAARLRPSTRHSSGRSWLAAAALIVVLGAAAVGLLGGVSGGLPILSDVAAVLDFLASTAVAGAGLLGASWSLLGARVGGWLQASPVNLAVAAAVLVASSLLLVALVRRRRAVPEPSRRGRAGRE